MTKEELLKRYDVKLSMFVNWTPNDDWRSVELYRLTHRGELPNDKDESLIWLIDMLDDMNANNERGQYYKTLMTPGLRLTAQKMILEFADEIIRLLREGDKS